MASTPSPDLLGLCICGAPIFRHRTVDHRQISCQALRQIDQDFKASGAAPQEPQGHGQLVRRTADQPDVLRPGALRIRLGLGESRFYELQRLGRFKHLESAISATLGARVYSRRKVDAAIDGAGPALSILRKRA